MCNTSILPFDGIHKCTLTSSSTSSRVEIVMETDCFIKAAQYCMRHIPASTLAGTPPTDGIHRGVERGRAIINFNKMGRGFASKGPWEHIGT